MENSESSASVIERMESQMRKEKREEVKNKREERTENTPDGREEGDN